MYLGLRSWRLQCFWTWPFVFSNWAFVLDETDYVWSAVSFVRYVRPDTRRNTHRHTGSVEKLVYNPKLVYKNLLVRPEMGNQDLQWLQVAWGSCVNGFRIGRRENLLDCGPRRTKPSIPEPHDVEYVFTVYVCVSSISILRARWHYQMFPDVIAAGVEQKKIAPILSMLQFKVDWDYFILCFISICKKCLWKKMNCEYFMS